MKYYIAIDPGSIGYICVRSGDGINEYFALSEHDPREIAAFFAKFSLRPQDKFVCVMEEVHAIFGSSAKATFSFGETFGFLKGLIIAYGFPYHLVQPKQWQNEIWITEDKVYRYKHDGKKMVDTKNTSINAAKRLFPYEDFRRNPRCKNIDDNKVDATLLAEFAHRRNL